MPAARSATRVSASASSAGWPSRWKFCEVSGTRSSLNRFEALRDRSAAALVGRNEEVQLLLSRWRRATDFEGQIVLLSGDAGIGKSRVVQTTRERIGPEAAVLRYQCSPFHQDTALFPVLQQIVRSIGLVDGQSQPRKSSPGRSNGCSRPNSTRARPSGVDSAISLQIRSPAHRLPDASPQQIRERSVALLLKLFTYVTKISPVLAIVEDVQWIDPTTEDLLIDVLGSIEDSRGDGPGDQPGRFLASLARGRLYDLPSPRALERRRQPTADPDDRRRPPGPRTCRPALPCSAEGIPLYLEELTLALLEAGGPRGLGEVPTSLHALLAARLDKMADAKPLLQVGAVLGRQFAIADLQAVAACSAADLRSMVAKSVASGLLRTAEPGNESILAFKHALVQDAAYTSLLNSEKRRLHAAALAHLEQKDGVGDRRWRGLAGVPCRTRRGLGQGGAILSSDPCRRRIAVQPITRPIALYDRTLNVVERLPAGVSPTLAIDARLHVFSPLLALGEIDRLVDVMRQAECAGPRLGRQAPAGGGDAASFPPPLWLAGRHEAGLQSAEEAVRLCQRTG